MNRVSVTIQRDTHKDGSTTFALRWRAAGDGPLRYHKVLRTEPDPPKNSLKRWEREVAVIRLEKERELNGEARDFVHHVRLVYGMQLYVDWCEEHRSRSTAHRVDRVLAHFGDYAIKSFGLRNVSSVGRFHVARYRDYLDERGLSASTINCYLSDLSAWQRWSLKEGYTSRNPVKEINRPTVVQTRAKVPLRGASEFWTLEQQMTTDIQAAVIGLIATTGLRIGEAAKLEWDDWDADLGVLTIRKQSQKETTKRHFRCLPVCQTCREFLMVLAMHHDMGPYVTGARKGQVRMTSQVNTWLKPYGLAPKHLRQFFRTSLETLGVEWYEIDDLMGHRTGKVRASYTPGHRTAKDLEGARRVIDQFDAWLREGKVQ